MATNYTAMTPQDYRELADRHCQMAEGASPEVAEKLLKIATSCDELAPLLERSPRSRPS